MSAVNKELNVCIDSSNSTISAKTIVDILMHVKAHVSDHKEKILEYLLMEKAPSVKPPIPLVGNTAKRIEQLK